MKSSDIQLPIPVAAIPTATRKGQRNEDITRQQNVQVSTILANDQLDAQFFYFIIRLLHSSTCFEQRGAHHQE